MQTLAPILAVISSDAADLSGAPASAPAGANAPAFDATMAAALADAQQPAPVSGEAVAAVVTVNAPAPAITPDEDATLSALANASELATRGMTARQPGPNLIRLVVTTPAIAPDQTGALPANIEEVAATHVDTSAGDDGLAADELKLHLATNTGDGEPNGLEPAAGAQQVHLLPVAEAADDASDANESANSPTLPRTEVTAATESAVSTVATIVTRTADHFEPEALALITSAPSSHTKKQNEQTAPDQSLVDIKDLDGPADLTVAVIPPVQTQGAARSETSGQVSDAAPPPAALSSISIVVDPPAPPAAISSVSPAPAHVGAVARAGKTDDQLALADDDADDEAPPRRTETNDPAALPGQITPADMMQQPQNLATIVRESGSQEAQDVRLDGPRARREQFLNWRASPPVASSQRAFAIEAPVADQAQAADARPKMSGPQAQPTTLVSEEQSSTPDSGVPEQAGPPALTITVNGRKIASDAPTADAARNSKALDDKLGALAKFGVREVEITTRPPPAAAEIEAPNAGPLEVPVAVARTTPQDQAASGPQATGNPATADAERRTVAADLRVRAMERQVIAAARAGTDEVRMQLYPPGLGQVIIRLTMDGARLRLSTRTQSQEATDALKDGETALRDALAVGGFDLTDFDVSDQGSNDSEPRQKTPETPQQNLDAAPAQAFAVDMNA